MWVEKHSSQVQPATIVSSSLWGCELKSQVRQRISRTDRHPPCEDVSWKSSDTGEKIETVVILLVRMWVENSIAAATVSVGFGHPPCEDVSWKGYWKKYKTAYNTSSSLWGCELKNCKQNYGRGWQSHPPCEDVSWKHRKEIIYENYFCHPPCEDVSWKDVSNSKYATAVPSSSLWGCELKRRRSKTRSAQRLVILLVRMWVEKSSLSVKSLFDPSSSLWGYELKRIS